VLSEKVNGWLRNYVTRPHLHFAPLFQPNINPQAGRVSSIRQDGYSPDSNEGAIVNTVPVIIERLNPPNENDLFNSIILKTAIRGG
jgi:hypothetical protein